MSVYLLNSCLEGFQQRTPLLTLCILGHPPQEVFIISPAPSLPDQALEGFQQGQQSIPWLYWFETANQI